MHQVRLRLISHVLSGIMGFCKVAVTKHALVSWLLQMTLQLNKQRNIMYFAKVVALHEPTANPSQLPWVTSQPQVNHE